MGTSLAKQIRALDDGERTTRDIADMVYGKGATHKNVTYVRVVTRQRKDGHPSRFDKKWLTSKKYKSWRKAMKPAFALAAKVLEKTGDKEKANAAARAAYAEARQEGQSVYGSQKRMRVARTAIMRATGDKGLARKTFAKSARVINAGR